MGQGWCSRAGRGGVGARGASSVVQLKLRRGAAESPAPAQVEHRGGLRAGVAGAKGWRRDGSDAAGVWPGRRRPDPHALSATRPATVVAGEP